MHNELNHIQDEKKYWIERLTRTTNEMFFHGNKKKRRMKPITTSKFMNFHKKHLQNRSILASKGMLTLDKTLKRPTRGGKNFYTLSDFGASLPRPVSGSPSHFRRNNRLKSYTVRASANRPDNFAWTVGKGN